MAHTGMRYTLDEYAEIGEELASSTDSSNHTINQTFNNCSFHYGSTPHRKSEHTVFSGGDTYYEEEEEEDKGLSLWDIGMLPFFVVGGLAGLTIKGLSSLLASKSKILGSGDENKLLSKK